MRAQSVKIRGQNRGGIEKEPLGAAERFIQMDSLPDRPDAYLEQNKTKNHYGLANQRVVTGDLPLQL